MYRFLVCELVTGKVLDELPLEITSDLTRYLKMYGEGTLSLPLFDGRGKIVSGTWEQSILPGRSLILVVDDQDRIVWHGIPQGRTRSQDYIVSYPCRTIESELIKRYVPTREYFQMDQARIFQSLLESLAEAGPGLEFDCPDTGVVRDRSYADDENARVYDRVNALSTVSKGFDWTIDVVWGDEEHTFVRKIARTGYPYLGNRTTEPVHTFETGQNIINFDYDEPWGEGDAATHVRAVGDGEGESKIMSLPVIDTARENAGWTRSEYRKSFSGVTEQNTINDHGRALAGYLFGGQQILTLTARNPGPGEDHTALGHINLGDTARAVVNTPQLTLDEVWPVVGWALTPDTGIYKPTLARIGAPDGE